MRRHLVAVMVWFLFVPGFPDISTAIYLCQDTEGRQVLTDSPAQLKTCTAIAPSSPVPVGPPQKGQIVRPAQPIEPQEPLNQSKGVPSNLPDHAITIPIQRVGNLFVATVKLSGEAGESDARLIVDTGASHTIVSHKLALELGLYSDSQFGTVMMNTVGGTVQAPMARLKSIRIGAVEVANSLAVIHDLPDSPAGAEGLLGLSALRHFQVTLDPNRGTLSLQPAQQEPVR